MLNSSLIFLEAQDQASFVTILGFDYQIRTIHKNSTFLIITLYHKWQSIYITS